ncbi:hypothetical protein PS3A_36370 [Pseudomonas sp. 3A(2025)]
MPSLFNPCPPDIEAMQCPIFDTTVIQKALQARRDGLGHQRLILGKRWADDLQELEWDSDGHKHTCFPLPPTGPEDQEVARLRTALPVELLAAINDSGLSLTGQVQMAQSLERDLDHYRASLDFHQVPQHEASLTRAEQAAGHSGYPPASTPDSGGQATLSVIPTGLFNTISTPRRYFRMLAWNLENFTRDRRPRGSAPIESVRNQARIAIVAEAMREHDVDLLLVMETGYDVGPAMTAIATRFEEIAGQQPHGTHPLVSPPTGALPFVATRYANRNLGRRSATKVLALRTLFEVYKVSAQNPQLPLTDEQMLTGWRLLRELSALAATLLPEATAIDVAIATTSERIFPNPQLVGWLRSEAANLPGLNGTRSDLPDLLYLLTSDLAGWIGLIKDEAIIDLSSPAFIDVHNELCDGIQWLRLYIDRVDEDIDDPRLREALVVYAQAVELLLLCFLQSLWGGIPQDENGLVFMPDQAEGNRLTLAIYLTAVSSSLDFDEIDPQQGPLEGEVDKDVVLDALQRLGFVDRHIETYGMVYRPPFADALQQMFDAGVTAHGYTGGSDSQASRYDIVRAPLLSGEFNIQQAGGLLNWRSALQVTVPVSDTLNVPLLLFHTRYSGTDEIATEYTGLTKKQRAAKKKADPDRLTVAEAEVKARTQTLSQMAQALLPGHSQNGMPLIVGDFNIPQEYLEPTISTTDAAIRKQGIRQELLLDMAKAGYLRHTRQGTLGEGHPLTTLKSFGSLALMQPQGSQPYDGVYQPFDFAQRGALVRSGVIGVRAIMSDKALSGTIKGITTQTSEIDIEDDDNAEVVTQDDSDDDNATVINATQMAVIQAVAAEVARVYAACVRRIVRGITDMTLWVTHLEGHAARQAENAGHQTEKRYAARAPSQALLNKLHELLAQGRDILPTHVTDREKWFVDRIVAGDFFDYATHTGQRDPLDACAQVLRETIAATRGWQQPHTALDDLESAIANVRTQLSNFELQISVRLAIAYRAVVSDHLPQIIELDLQPGP